MPFLRGLLTAVCFFVSFTAAAAAQESHADFVGSGACASCHEAQHGDWLRSQHKAAMQEPSETSVLGRFDGAAFKNGASETIFFKKEGRFFIHAAGPDGKPGDFAVRYVFGVAPLQQYLLELPGGRLQAFGIAWDSRPAEQGGQRWFDLYPDRRLAPGDPLHWTGIDQNWNYQCAWCHSTNLRKNYDPASSAFATSFSEISVGCEACHGPGSNHLAWAASPSTPTSNRGFAIGLARGGVSWRIEDGVAATRTGPPAGDKEALICAGCHSRRQQFSDDPLAAARFYDAFRPVTLEAGLYHLDGQQRDEVYNFGSFLQSRMHGAGVTCADCHNPHSGKLRLAGSAVCGQCHAANVFDAPAHHHHQKDSAGAQCANCHMPTTTYMGVDKRHDHSMRIPRPDRTASLATPNACNACHDGKSAAWAVEALKSWGAGSRPGAQNFAEAFHLADANAPGAQTALAKIVSDDTQSAIARASALQRLSQTPTAAALEAAKGALADKSPMARAAAVAVFANADAATKRDALAPLLSDDTRLVRMDAARALAGEAEAALSEIERASFEKALAEYEAGQRFNAERPESQANLGALYVTRGDPAQARAAYEKALALDPTFAPAAISLADLLRSGGDEAGAEGQLRKAFLRNPESGALAHALGLSLIRQKRLPEAMANLEEAARLAPDDARFAYVYGVALHDAGAAQKAIETLRRALSAHTFDRDILTALASYEAEEGDVAAALPHAERLAELEPEDQSLRAFVNALRAQGPKRDQAR
ncbi:tetratricopeptide repeat protein [Methylocystis parvus]|uniref:Tetratricopeptide repeat protein n=1 Tax=Methylocystis parvus TaxID=134 RepID=A0A6B8M3X4_9HYPH|nr:tetratricopeptide repeat protein [Methylocystis parvus]QGM97601.1 tetratricopeptide repeat protein [Methylocystis parvus]WBJ98466.1 tetratricopeptide repeat protein [Methylocystis parvus OBBP]